MTQEQFLPRFRVLLLALRSYWQRVLTRPGRFLALAQLALVGSRLVCAGELWPGWLRGSPMEALLLAAFLLQWCAWSELLYSLRCRFQPLETTQGSPGRRFALHLYGGFLFLGVLSLLASVQPLLGIGAMFLLFTSVESLDHALARQPLGLALLGGVKRSYQLMSHEPWQFLGRLLFPGMVLYAGGVLLVWLREDGLAALPPFPQWLVLSLGLALWLGFFALAQLRIASRAVVDLDVDVLMGKEPPEASPNSTSIQTLRALLRGFESLCLVLAAGLGLAIGGWVLLQLGHGELLNTEALAMAFGAVVNLLSRTVSAFLSLLVNLGFITVVGGGITVLLMVIIGFGRKDPLKLLRRVLENAQNILKWLAGSFAHLDVGRATPLGLGTLLTALGTVAVQTYARVQQDQVRQQESRLAVEEQRKKEQEETRVLSAANDGRVDRITRRVGEFRKEAAHGSPGLLADQLLSDLRDVLPEVKTIEGAVDGPRKGKLLRYLYESDLLLPPEGRKNCAQTVAMDLRNMAAKEAQKQLGACSPPLFLYAMDFSGATLEKAYLAKAFLPYLSLRNANLRGAVLQDAVLRYADLENADLTGADLTRADLTGANLVGTNLTNITAKQTIVSDAVAFYSVFPPQTRRANCAVNDTACVQATARVISWDLVKGRRPADPPQRWSFCPLDPADSSGPELQGKVLAEWIPQAGSKCRNRRFHLEEMPGLAQTFRKRDWSGSALQQSSLQGLRLEKVDLSGADLSGATFEAMRLKDVKLNGANLQDATFRDSVLEDVDFRGANLQRLRLERVKVRNPLYQGSVLDLEETQSFGTYGKRLLRNQVLNSKTFQEGPQEDEVATFRQNVVAPLLLAPLPLRPQQLLYWMFSYPLPTAWEP